jgi:hypothetical protein
MDYSRIIAIKNCFILVGAYLVVWDAVNHYYSLIIEFMEENIA